MKEIKPKIGDRIKVELISGHEFVGIFDIHILAGDCVKNKFGFPMNYKRILEILTPTRGK